MRSDENHTAGAGAEPTGWLPLAVAWVLVGVPLAWGMFMTVLGAVKLFTS